MMTRRMGMVLGAVVIVTFLSAGFTGLLLVQHAGGMAEYTDPDRLQLILPGNCPNQVPREDMDACTQRWFRDIGALRTPKWTLHDSGRGLLAFSATALAFIALARLWDARRFGTLTTPRSRATFVLVGSIIWLAQIPVYQFRLMEEAGRNYFPWWADSLALPLAANAVFTVGALPVLLASGWLALRKAHLPAQFWIFDVARWGRSLVWTLVYGCLALALLAATADEVVRGSFMMVPLLLTGLYLVLAARAAVLSVPLRSPDRKRATAQDRTANAR